PVIRKFPAEHGIVERLGARDLADTKFHIVHRWRRAHRLLLVERDKSSPVLCQLLSAVSSQPRPIRPLRRSPGLAPWFKCKRPGARNQLHQTSHAILSPPLRRSRIAGSGIAL